MLEKAFAKINLGLDIVGKRPDGYHEVNMVMQSIELADEVELLPAQELSVITDSSDVPGGRDNLAWKSVMLMAEKFGHKPNVQVSIKKRIFMAAGLAGGSADAAAVLEGLTVSGSLTCQRNNWKFWLLNWVRTYPFVSEGERYKPQGVVKF